jgi:hypothetical protein
MTFVKQAPLFPEQDLQPQQPSETVNSRADSPEQAFDADPAEHEPDPDAEDSPYTRLAPPVAVDSESAPVVYKQHAQVGTATDADAELAIAAELSPYTLLPPNHPDVDVGSPEITVGETHAEDIVYMDAEDSPYTALIAPANEPEHSAAPSLDDALNFEPESDAYAKPLSKPLSEGCANSAPATSTALTAMVDKSDPTAQALAGDQHRDPDGRLTQPSTAGVVGAELRTTAQEPDAAADFAVDVTAARPIARPVQRLMPLAARPPSDRKAWGRLRPDTQKDYEYRVHLLYRNASERRTQDPHIPHVVSPLEVAQDLIESVTGPTPRSLSSWRVNRSALLSFLASNRHRSEKFVEAYDLLVAAEGPPKPLKIAATAFIDLTSKPFQPPTSRRRQGIPLNDLILLLNTLAAQNTPRSDIGSCVQFWLQAGIGAGPRVAEWPGVAWLDRAQGLLSIPNAKLKVARPASAAIKSARAAGQEVHSVHDIEPSDADSEDYSAGRAKRRVVQVTEENALWVDLHLSAMWSYLSSNMAQGVSLEEAFKNYYDRCRNQLLEACKIAFQGRRSYTLRMARSQFAANAKMTASFEEVAEMMGHEVSDTTIRHYAPRRFGWRTGAQADRQGQRDPAQQSNASHNRGPAQSEGADQRVRD